MRPDPVSGRVLRAAALLLFGLCGALAAANVGGCDAARATERARRRVVSVGGAVTETVFALGAGAEVVAVDTSSVYPEAVNRLPKVGYQRTLAAEGILALSPDLVVASEEAGPPATLQQLRDAGVRVALVPSAKSLDEAAARVAVIGEVLGRPAAALAAQLRREGAAARARVPAGGPRFVLVYARGASTLLVAGGDTSGSAMVELAGGRNAAGEVRGFRPLSPEVLVDAAPEVLVIPARGLATIGGEAGLLAIPGVAETPAGRARRVVAFDDLLLLGFGPRLPIAIDELAHLLRAAPGEAAVR